MGSVSSNCYNLYTIIIEYYNDKLYSILEVVFPPVDADSNVNITEDNPIEEILDETVDKKKKKPKQKIGFRDRKVFNFSFIIN